MKHIKREIDKYDAYKDNGVLSDFGEELLNDLNLSVEIYEALKSFVNDFDNNLIEDYQIPRDRFEQLIKKAIEL